MVKYSLSPREFLEGAAQGRSLRVQPKGTLKGRRLYFTLYLESSPNMDNDVHLPTNNLPG